MNNQSTLEIIPAIYAPTPEEAQQQWEHWQQLDPPPQTVQADIIDGEFAPELTVEPNFFNEDLFIQHSTDQGDTKIDLHLMTIEPIDYVHEVYNHHNIRYVIGQIERMYNLQEFVDEVVANHLQPGLALDLNTPFEEIDLAVLSQLQVVQVMGGQAGWQGQSFQAKIIDKIKQIKEVQQDLQYEFAIMVDIGMNPETISQAAQAGANKFVVGSYLQSTNSDQRQKNWEELQEVINNLENE